jgi:hypothetical protein
MAQSKQPQNLTLIETGEETDQLGSNSSQRKSKKDLLTQFETVLG